jgi:8-oxo-dGTP pyrophosphatase MutT (NUDIX family)
VIVAHTYGPVAYLPQPNRIEIVFDHEESDPLLTRTAFIIPVFDDGTILLAQNQRRGIEVPGGHVDPGETLREAAIREAFEEVGCTVSDVVPIGYLRMMSEGEVPADYPYPHPLSFQQFFAGRVAERHPYRTNDECAEPVRVSDLSGFRPSIAVFGQRARDLFQRVRDPD